MKRPDKIRLAIKAAKLRIKQLEELTMYCPLCAVFKDCWKQHPEICPVSKDFSIEPSYWCVNYSQDIHAIQNKLEEQIEEWEEWLRIHK